MKRQKSTDSDTSFEIGVISDTHGPLERRAADALEGCQSIIHAGDIVDEMVIFNLQRIAPTTAVRGNMDGYMQSKDIRRSAVMDVEGTLIYVLHDIGRLDLDPKAAGISVVVHGHTHKPEIETKNGVLYLNPGSAGSPRHGRRPSVARITISSDEVSARIIEF